MEYATVFDNKSKSLILQHFIWIFNWAFFNDFHTLWVYFLESYSCLFWSEEHFLCLWFSVFPRNFPLHAHQMNGLK